VVWITPGKTVIWIGNNNGGAAARSRRWGDGMLAIDSETDVKNY
jgi:hypothetical protein